MYNKNITMENKTVKKPNKMKSPVMSQCITCAMEIETTTMNGGGNLKAFFLGKGVP